MKPLTGLTMHDQSIVNAVNLGCGVGADEEREAIIAEVERRSATWGMPTGDSPYGIGYGDALRDVLRFLRSRANA